MIYGEVSRLSIYDPYIASDSAVKRISDLMFNSLITTNQQSQYVGDLAKSWDVNKKGNEVKITLRKDVFWHTDNQSIKGPPLSADDVKTTVRILKSDMSTIPNSHRFKIIKSVKILSNSQIIITFLRSLKDPLKNLMFKILPHHQLKNISGLNRQSEFSQRPVGTGPYQLSNKTSQGELLLKASNHYYQGKVGIPSILVRSFNDPTIMAQALMYNSINLIPYVSPRDLPEVSQDAKIGIIPYDALSFTFIAFNNRRTYLKKKWFRQALSLAVNRKEMLTAFFDNNGTLISGPFPPTSWAYNLDVPVRKHQPEIAKKILLANGLKKTGNQWFDPKTGSPIKLTFAVPIGIESETIKRIALAYQAYMGTIGVIVDLQFMDWLLWKEKVLADHDFDITIASWSFDDANNISSLFHSKNDKRWGNNFVGFRNRDVDTMLTEAEATNDFDKKRHIYHSLHSVLSEEVPYTYLWTLLHHAAHTDRIENIRVDPFSFFKYVSHWNFEGEVSSGFRR